MTEHEAAPEQSSEAGAAEQGATTAVAEPIFEREELARFDADDTQAGRAIGRMLALFFFYTVVIMSFISWWTFRAIQ